MNQEDKILDALAALTASMQKGFSDMAGRFEAIESRLDLQEKKTRKVTSFQQLQEAEIAELRAAVKQIAEREPLRTWHGGTAIRKETAYREFEKHGVGRVTALRALQKDGLIKAGDRNRRTQVIYHDGHAQRVIVVQIEN